MNEFNSKQYYGYSVRNDPDLVTTARNFEFKYMRPEFLERAIQKVHKEQDNNQQSERPIRQNMGYVRTPTTENGSMEECHPHRGETQFVRHLSTEEIDNIIRKVKTQTPTSPKCNNITEVLYSSRMRNLSPLGCQASGMQSPTKYGPTENLVSASTPPLLSPRGPIKGILRKLSVEKAHEKRNHQNVDHTLRENQHSPNFHSGKMFVTTATSPLLSSRRENYGLLRPLSTESEEKNFPTSERQHSPSSYLRKNLISTATSPLISPRKEDHNISANFIQEDEPNQRVEDLNQTYNLPSKPSIYSVEYAEPEKPSAQVPQIIDNVKLEEYQKPKAKWIKLIEPSKGSLLETKVEPKHNRTMTFQYSQSPRVIRNHEFHRDAWNSQKAMDYPQKTISHNTSDYAPTSLMTEVIKENLLQADSYINVSPYEDHQASVENIILEDSDMEFEISERPHYTKYIKPKPTPEEMLNFPFEDDGGLAEFIEIEKNINDMDVGYLKNSASLRFTEITEDSQDDHAQTINQMKIYIGSKDQQRHSVNVNPTEIFSTIKPPPLSAHVRCPSPSQSIKQTTRKAKTLREQHLQRTFERLAGGGIASGATSCSQRLRSQTPDGVETIRTTKVRSSCASSTQPQSEIGSCTNRKPTKKEKSKRNGRQVLTTNLKISKSIENLKSEKTRIFQKMAEIQEKIIEVLNKLRINLLDINIPENKVEKSKRQKNALEFAVRFSRNFLYPLRGLLDELKATPIEQFNSLASNEASNRVCYTYNLLLQSLNTYQKQLRYFHLDHVPQKLPALIDIINTTTSICLEKTIFSREDERIAFLQQSCDKFLNFLNELQDGRLNTARENYRKLTLEKASPKYDLKMIMNPLNMYEPMLVPKVGTSRKKSKPTKRHITSVAIEETKEEIKEKPKDDSISTQVQNLPVDSKSSDCFQPAILNTESGDGLVLPVDSSFMQALQALTAEQAQLVLFIIWNILNKKSALSRDCLDQLLTNLTSNCQA